MAKAELDIPDDFSGVVRLFPLPNMVLFPGVVQGLHIFEPRYKQMVEEAVAGDQLIAMAMVRPEQLSTAGDRPALFDTVCIGKIMTHAQLEDGRYNLLLAGVKRARILEEVNFELDFRKARVELLADTEAEEPADQLRDLRQQVVDQFLEMLPSQSHLDRESLDSLLASDVGTGQLVDLICYSCGAQPMELQQALEIDSVVKRAQFILKTMRRLAKQSGNSDASNDFPPKFSLN
jgi:ATP-dependent Lon protease